MTAEVCPYPAKSNEAKNHDSRRPTCRSSHRPTLLAFQLFLSHCCPDGLLSAALAPSPTYQDLDPSTPSYQADLTSDPDSSLRRSICLASCHTSSPCHGNRIHLRKHIGACDTVIFTITARQLHSDLAAHLLYYSGVAASGTTKRRSFPLDDDKRLQKIILVPYHRTWLHGAWSLLAAHRLALSQSLLLTDFKLVRSDGDTLAP